MIAYLRMQLFRITLVSLCLVVGSESLATTIYVDWDANDGSCWRMLANYLQDTLMACMGRQELIQYPMNGRGAVSGRLWT